MSRTQLQKGSRLVATVLFSAFMVPGLVAQAETGKKEQKKPLDFLQAFTEGEVNVSFNYRFENVDQNGIRSDGRASTLRTTLGYRTGKFQGFQGYLEFEDVSDLGGGRLHRNLGAGSYSNGITTRPVIADPVGTAVQQAYLDYGYRKSRARFGAQEIVLDDARFVGNVGWRQHHQSYDALLLTTQEIENAAVALAYINKVKTITRATLETNTFIVNGHYDIDDVGRLTVFDIYIDLTQAPSALSSNTIGAELKGKRKLDEQWGYRYEFDFASQSDVSDNPTSFTANYYHLALGGTYENFGVTVGYEVLGSDNGNAGFQTLLATKHAWNGWADKFLGTPANGLRDLYIKLNGPVGPVKAALIYHKFEADNGNADYGQEVDGVLKYKASWGQSFLLKFARYDADTVATDTTKIWLSTGFKF